MHLKSLKYILLATAISIGGYGIVEVSGAPKKKAKTTATASKSKKKKTKSTKKSGATKKTTSAKNKFSRKSTSKRKTTRRKTKTIAAKQYVAPPDPILNDSLTLLINDSVLNWVPETINPGGLRVNSVRPDTRTHVAKIGLNENFTYLPVTSEFIADLRKRISSVLPDSIADYNISLNVRDKSYAYYITTIDKLPPKYRNNTPFVVAAKPLVHAKKGMDGDIVALWPSHGKYFNTDKGSWLWQRPKLFQLTEDTHTMAYILPYAVPMIENAGAYVMLPRERDYNPNEIIVDNDNNEGGQLFSQPYYREMTGEKTWATGEEDGFIYDLADFRDTENPFENGTYRQTTTVTNATKQSLAAWYADIPVDGEYAIYVSYKSLPNSTTDARYTVNYSGGTREFIVNQSMGGGTWIYLGTFPLEAGYSDVEPIVTLSNLSKREGAVLTADAVKIGGGMGNIARSSRRSDIFLDPSTPETIQNAEDEEIDDEIDIVSEENEEENEGNERNNTASNLIKTQITQSAANQNTTPVKAPVFRVSGLPRYLEGARYWLQWAGMPEEIYSPYHGTDDYKDDYTSRGHWVNYLAGGSRVLPGRDGLGIPVDVAVALHSDAGKRADDSFVGTLGIYYSNGGDLYLDGTARANSRSLTDLLMRQITGDIRQTWEPNWTRRSMWDKSYVEARVPEVPTSLIELLSHQNFADMKYALDPEFRFTVGRSIYKAIGRFIAERKDRNFVVQPLPVKNFAIRKIKPNYYRLSWSPTPDRLEPTATPDKYIILERTADELGFHVLGETTQTDFDIKVSDNDIHSFKIIAANEGGLSFDSEILALRESPDGGHPVLIINGFTRISAPSFFSNGNEAGFDATTDFGVPDKRDISFIGYQTEFRRNSGESFGNSSDNYVGQVIAGNTFDFPYVHGEAIADAGRGFISASVGAVINGDVKLTDYRTVDLILGKQKITVTGNGNTGFRHFAFPVKLQDEVKKFVSHGGDLFVSGAYLLTDLYDYRTDGDGKAFATEILGISRQDGSQEMSGRIDSKGTSIEGLPEMYYSNSLNEQQYIVENPDKIIPSGKNNGEQFLVFSNTGNGAGVLSHNGSSHRAVMSVPFESIRDKGQRNLLMKKLLDFLEK